MASKGQQTGMRAVFLVAAELVDRDFIVSLTSRNGFGADLLVTNEACTRAYSVQVKANRRSRSFWLLGEKTKGLASRSHVYVFVNLDASGKHEYYVVPSREVTRRMRTTRRKTGSIWYSFYEQDAHKYRDAWHLFRRAGRTAG